MRLQCCRKVYSYAAQLFVFGILGEGKQHCRGGTTEGWDHPAAAPSLSPSHSYLIPSFPLLFILQLQSCASLSLSLSFSQSFSFSLSSVCPRDTKMDGDAPGMGCIKGLYHKVSSLSCIRPALLPSTPGIRMHVYWGVGGVLSGTVWQQMLLFGQKSERGLGWVGGLSRVRAQSFFSPFSLTLALFLCVSVSPAVPAVAAKQEEM